MLASTANVTLITIDKEKPILDINLAFHGTGGWNLRKLYENISMRLKFPSHDLGSFALFHKSKYLSYNKLENFKTFQHDVINSKDPIPIKIAAYFSEDVQILDLCKRHEIPMMSPLNIRLKSGWIVETVEKIYNYTSASTLRKMLCPKLPTDYAPLLLCYENRILEMTDLIGDIYFETGVLNLDVELTVYKKVEYDSQTSHLSEVTVEFISGSFVIELTEDFRRTVYDLKYLIFKARRVPIKQQTLMYKGTVLNGYEMLNDVCDQENISSDTTNITINLLVQPHYINLKFISDCIDIPGDGLVELSGMTTAKDIKSLISNIVKLPIEKFVLVPPYLNNISVESQYGEDLMLHELQTSKVKIVRFIRVEIEGQYQFDYSILKKNQTINDLRNELEISHDYKRQKSELVLQNEMEEHTILSGLQQDVIIKFEVKKIDKCSCILS